MITNLVTKVKIETFNLQLKCHYNKTVIDYDFGSHKAVYTLKNPIMAGHLDTLTSIRPVQRQSQQFSFLISKYSYLPSLSRAFSLCIKKLMTP